jgi:hypothetical protein
MRLSCVLISANFAITGLLGSPTIASAEDTSTCEVLAGALSGAEKDSFLKKCEETFRAGHVCAHLIVVAKMARKTAVTQLASSTATRSRQRAGLVQVCVPGLGTYWAYWNSGIAFNASFVAPGRTNLLSTNLN